MTPGFQTTWRHIPQDSKSQHTYRLFATRVSQLKIWNFWDTGIERNVCRCTVNRYSVITQFAKLAAGEQLCRRCTHRRYSTSKTLKVSPDKSQILSCDTVVTLLWHCCDTAVTQLWHCCDTAVTQLTLVWHWCDTAVTHVTLLWHCCDTAVTQLWHCCRK
jgi:hypothetical protein